MRKHLNVLGVVDSVSVFFYLLTFSMLHYIVILHAFGLSIHNMVTYIYNLCTVSSIFYRYCKFNFGFVLYCFLLFNLVSAVSQ